MTSYYQQKIQKKINTTIQQEDNIDSQRLTQRLKFFNINSEITLKYQQYFKFNLKPMENKEEIIKGQNMLAFGYNVKKYTKKGEGKHSVFIFISDQDKNILQYISQKKAYTETRIDLTKILKLQNEPTYRYLQKVKPADKDKLLVVNDLHLEFENKEDRDAWWIGLQYYIIISKKEVTEKQVTNQQEEMIKKVFMQVDKNGDRELDKKEVKKTLQELHIQFTEKELQKKFDQFDADKSGKIEYNEFIKLMKSISRKKELEKIFFKYAIKIEQYQKQESKITGTQFTVNDIIQDNVNDMQNNQILVQKSKEIDEYFIYFEFYKQFLQQEQQQDVEDMDEAIQKKIVQFKKANKENFKFVKSKQKEDYKISFDVFCNMIFSKQNVVFDPKLKEFKKENMNESLSDYYIKSSHNTYLTGNQLTGESNIDAYIKALNEDFRCVELDCWNDPNPAKPDKPEPIVYHGHTLTSKITFREIIEIINKIGFANNKYPIILSLENHCDVKNQTIMAEIMESVFQDKLYKLPKNWKSLDKFPSPNQLIGKVIVKGKGKPDDILCQDNDVKKVNSICQKPIINDSNLQVNQDQDSKTQIQSNNSLNLNRVISGTSQASQQQLLNNNNINNKENGDVIVEENQKSDESFHNNNINSQNMIQSKEKNNNINNNIEKSNRSKIHQNVQDDVILFTSQEQETVQDDNNIQQKNIIQQLDNDIKEDDILIGVQQSENPSMQNSGNQIKNLQVEKKSKFSEDQHLNIQNNNNNGISSIESSPKKKSRRNLRNRSSKKFENNSQVYLEDLKENKNTEKNTNQDNSKTQKEEENNENVLYTSQDESSESDFEPLIQNILHPIDHLKAQHDLQNDNTKLNKDNKQYSKYQNQKGNENNVNNKIDIKSENVKSMQKEKKQKKVKLSLELQKCITMFGCHFKLNDDNKRTCWNISSLGESKLMKLYNKNFQEMELFHQKFFTRIYPGGFRIDSSNYNPVPSLVLGSQIIALNVQKEDDNKQILHGKFQENGGCGYVLKPEYLRKGLKQTFEFIQKMVTITVISAQQLRPDDFTNDVSDIVDPYISIQLQGHKNDEQDPKNKIKKTHTIQDNGFNPIFNSNMLIQDNDYELEDILETQENEENENYEENNQMDKSKNQNMVSNNNLNQSKQNNNKMNSQKQKKKQKEFNKFTFQVRCPEQALFTFRAFDKDTITDERLGIYTLPLTCMLPGYRVIPMYNKQLQLVDHAYVFVKIEIQNVKYENHIHKDEI